MIYWQVGSIQLPGDLEWSDERTWSKRRQIEEISLAGTSIIQQSVQVSGRPLTLVTPEGVWVTLQQIIDLQDFWEDPATNSFQVSHPDGRNFVCKFRTGGANTPVEGAPIYFESPLQPTHPHTMTLRLMFA